MTLATLLDKDVQVLAMTIQVKGGARVKQWNTIAYASLPAAIQPRKVTNRALFKQSGIQITHVVYLGDETGGYGNVNSLVINQGDMIVFAEPGKQARRFEIVGAINQDEANRFLRCECMERHG
jgi:hypothetical protein